MAKSSARSLAPQEAYIRVCSACDVWNTVSVSTSELMPAFPQKMGPFFFFQGTSFLLLSLWNFFFPLIGHFPRKEPLISEAGQSSITHSALVGCFLGLLLFWGHTLLCLRLRNHFWSYFRAQGSLLVGLRGPWGTLIRTRVNHVQSKCFLAPYYHYHSACAL